MTKTIKLSVEEARELYKKADSTFKSFLETNFDKKELCSEIEERIQNWQDILDELGIDESFLPYKNPKTKEEKSLNAVAKIYKITEVYNEGWYADFKNNDYKWYPYKYFSGGRFLVAFYWYCSVTDGHAGGFYFKSENLAKDAYNKFKDVYEDYWMI